MARPTFTDYRDYMRWRLDRRVETIKHRVESVKKNYIDKLRPEDIHGKGGEDDRLWLDQFCKGKGLDIACGDFLCGEDQASGVDGHERQIGTDHFNEGDELTFSEPGKIDFIVTNYLDAFPNPLKVLNEWYRALKFSGGCLAIVCRDAEQATDKPKGPLENGKRQSLYTVVTLAQYMYRAGFTEVKVAKTTWGSLRAVGYKRADPGNKCPKCGQDRG